MSSLQRTAVYYNPVEVEPRSVAIMRVILKNCDPDVIRNTGDTGPDIYPAGSPFLIRYIRGVVFKVGTFHPCHCDLERIAISSGSQPNYLFSNVQIAVATNIKEISRRRQ